MYKLTAFIATAYLTLHLNLPALAAPASTEWFQWRGPSREGKSPDTGLLQEWPAGGPPLVWKTTGLGGGYASVALSGDRLFTMGDEGGASHLLALSRADGKRLWSTKVGKAGAPGWGGFAGPRCTPTVNGSLVFAVDQWGELTCVEAATGKELWRKNYEKFFRSDTTCLLGF
jgi:outer membrane protein assembly factor BamB